jgi:hypothetical protein
MPSYHKTGFGRFSVNRTGKTARIQQKPDEIPVFLICIGGMGKTQQCGQDRQPWHAGNPQVASRPVASIGPDTATDMDTGRPGSHTRHAHKGYRRTERGLINI